MNSLLVHTRVKQALAENKIVQKSTNFTLSSDLWGFLLAAFPQSTYVLCTATMTDEALGRITGKWQQIWSS